MKKRCFVLVAVLLSLQITGCGAINLTTQEKNVIAEYIANILLKHDTTYEPTFQYDLEEEEPIEKPEKKPKKKPKKKKEEKEDTTVQKEQTTGNTPKKNDTKKYTAISTVYKSNLKVSSSGYSFYKTYPERVNAILPIEASAGNTICIVNLKLKNSSASSKKLNFLQDSYSYQLEVDSKKTYKAVQSLLVDDIQYLDVELKAGKSCQAIVAFEIPEKAKKKSLKLLVTKGSNTAALKIK